VAVVTGSADIGPRDHIVQFYCDDQELASQAGDYLEDAVRDGAVVVVIATSAHRAVFQTRLAAAGIDVSAVRASGAYLDLDAAETAGQLVGGDRLEAARFGQVIGGLIGQAAAGGRPVRVYGEIVALLWDTGLVAAAVELEQAWSQLGRQYDFSLYCAYPAGAVTGKVHASAFARVCRLHSAVIGQIPVQWSATGTAEARTRAFSASREAPAAARHFVVAALAEVACGASLADDAALVVTEFAANAVIHARSGFTVMLTPLPDGLRVSVRDDVPLPAGSALPAARLHGLGAVAAVAARWGAGPASGGGKDVWAELRQ